MAKYSSYILFLLITFFVVIISLNGVGPLDNLQRSMNDFLSSFTAPEEVSSDIVMVTIDGAAIDAHGNWPWNQDKIADLIAATAQGQPKVIALDFMLNEDSYQDSAGYTDILAGQMSWVKNLVIPYDIALATYRDNRTNNPKYLFKNSISIDNPLGVMDEYSSLIVRKVFLPSPKILNTKPHLGFDYTMPDEDRIVRHHATIMNFEGYYYPSLPLAATSAYLGRTMEQVKISEGNQIAIDGNHKFPINTESELFISFPKSPNFRKISAAKILSEKININILKNKLILLTVDNPRTNQYYKTVVHEQVSKSFITASIMQNIIDNNILNSKTDNAMMNLLLLFVIGGLCAFIMPQVSAIYRFIILGCGLIILANINYFMFTSLLIIPNTIYIALELILFMIASPFVESEFLTGVAKQSSPIKSKMPKGAVPKIEKAGLNDTPVPVRKIQDSPTDAENLKTTMISDVSAKDHQSINLNATSMNANEEKKSDLTPNNSSSEPEIIGGDSFSESDQNEIEKFGNISLEDSEPQEVKLQECELKKLGRYEILGTLGKGAMGHVYKGVDPAINRPVALKTIRLDFVNDIEEMEELKERLFREAQAAGKLSHPNIVTIYDVGSEDQLQYIAMEYLDGRTLEDLIKKKTKLNFKIISKVITQICDALEYAHDKGIVHRDIKPANIMITSDYDVKLLDYGIARVDSNSMTKTGIAMGTPNYISPEQLKGQSVDKRADLFSLGVVIYELLLGRRPFKGENITSLIYSVMNHEPEKPSNLNPQIPLLFDHIVSRALQKDPDERYQKASELKNDLSDFVESFSSR